MAIHTVYPDQYQNLLDAKIANLNSAFARFQPPPVAVYPSRPSHYRMRAEFKVWHSQDDRAHYAMFTPGETKKPFVIDSFPVGSALLNELMPQVLDAINGCDILRQKLFQAEFLTTTTGAAVITLIYHKALSDAWQQQAEALSQRLGHSLIGRSKKQKRVIGQDFVTEVLEVNGRRFSYQQVETGFTQPNAGVCQSMLGWALEVVRPLGGDLLELYCGNGNFTIPLATHFRRVLATEIAKTSVNSARYNFALNQIDNVAIARMSSEEFTQALDGVRAFRRLEGIDLAEYDFSTIFVDPPRSGLDPQTTAMAARFDNILYVSCNPQTLAENLDELTKTHRITRFAAFDQFPYTPHLECGVMLQRC